MELNNFMHYLISKTAALLSTQGTPHSAEIKEAAEIVAWLMHKVKKNFCYPEEFAEISTRVYIPSYDSAYMMYVTACDDCYAFNTEEIEEKLTPIFDGLFNVLAEYIGEKPSLQSFVSLHMLVTRYAGKVTPNEIYMSAEELERLTAYVRKLTVMSF